MAILPIKWAGLNIPPAAALNAVAQRQLRAAGAQAVVPLTYGESRTSGLLLNVIKHGSDTTRVLVQVLWGHACAAVDQLKLNDQDLPGTASVTTYTGSQAAVDSTLAAAFTAQSITYPDTLAGYAYSVVSLPVTDFQGQLAFSARVQGRRLYDPRKDSTNGGTGAHRLNNPATWEYSANPALALADWLYSSTYGAGQAVLWSSVITQANANDAMIGSPAETHRQIGLTLADAAQAADVAEALRAYAGCWLLPTAGGVKLLADAAGASVAAYSHASGQIADISALDLRDMGNSPTVVEVVYTNTSAIPWREASATAQLAGAGTTLPWRKSVVRMPGIQRHSQAAREATERLNKLALTALSCTLDVFDGGIAHEVGDVVTVTHPAGLSAKPMRIVSPPQRTGPGRWRLPLAEYSAAVYSTAVAAGPAYTDAGRVAPPGPPANVSGLAVNVAQGLITWSWDGVADRNYAETRVRLGGTDWASAAPVWSGRGTQWLQRVTTTGTRTLRVRHANQDGDLSAATASASITVVAGDLVQSEPGTPGQSTVVVNLYQWASSTPANPSANSTWNWNTAAHSSYTGGAGWSVSVGANPGTAGVGLWIASKPVTAAVGTTSSTVSWDAGFTVYKAAVNGSTGPAGATGPQGAKAALPTVYQWANSTPTVTGSGTYTWANGDVGTVPSGWSVVPGSGSPGQTLYGASVQLIDASGATTTAINWTTASITPRGYQGTNGAAGATGAAGLSAKRAYVLTASGTLGSGTVVTTGASSLPPGTSVFGSGLTWAAAPSTPAVGQHLFQSDGIFDPAANQITWNTPYISALKVGNLAALAVNTGALTVQDALTVVTGGQVKSSNYSAGSAGWMISGNGTAEFAAASIRGQLTAAQIDSTGLTIKDAAGNVILGAGASVNPADYMVVPSVWVNNLMDASWWTQDWQPTINGWNGNTAGDGTTDYIVPGTLPGGNAGLVWRAIAGSGGNEAGGWNPGNSGSGFGNSFAVNTSRCYRFCVPIRRVSGTGTAYWGIQSDSVCGLNTTTPNGNPYFSGSSSLTAGRWYLLVGYVFPYGKTGYTHDAAGIYDMLSGQQVASGSNFNWAAGVTSVGTRAYQYYASAGATQWFAPPMVHLVDGTEPTLDALLASGSVSGRNPLTAANASTYIANATIGVAHINTASIGSLSALSANMGTVTIDSAGHVKGGQTAYSTGTGFFLGYSSGAYRFSIGNPAGAQLTWDGTDLRLTGQVFGSMSIAAISDIGGTVSAGTNKLLGSRSAVVTGGTGTLTYRWVILSQNNNPSTRSCYLSSYTSATVYVYINSIASGNETDVAVMCTVTDANGRAAVQQFTVGVLGV